MARPIAPAALIRRQVVLEEHDPLPDGSGAVVVRRFVHGETYRSHLHLSCRFAGAAPRRAVPPAAPRQLTAGRGPRHVSPASRPTAGASPSCARSRTTRTARRRSWSRRSTAASRGSCGRRSTACPRSPGRPTAGGWRSSPPRRRPASSSARRRRAGSSPRAGSPGPTGAGTRSATATAGTRSGSGRCAQGAKPRRLTRQEADAQVDRVGARRALDRLRRRPAAGRRPPAAPLDLGRARRRRAAARGRPPRRVRRLARPSRPTAAGSPASASTSPTPLDDEQPGALRRSLRSRRRRPAPAPSPLAPDLDRPIGAWNDTDLNGWMVVVAARAVLGRRRTPCVALVSDGGPGPALALPVRPGDRPARPALPRASPTRDIAAWTLGVAGGVVSIVATLDDRPMELLTVERADAGRPHGRARTRRVRPARPAAASWRRGIAWPDDATRRGARRRRPDRDLDRLAGRRRRRAAADGRQRPRRPARGLVARRPSLENVLLASRGYRVDPAEHPRLGRLRQGLDHAPARRLGRRRRRRRPGGRRPRRRPRPGRPGAARHPRPVVRRLHGQLADRRGARTASPPPSPRTA